MKITNIVKGWKNLVFKDPEIEKLAIKRANICDNCTYASTDETFDMSEDGDIISLKGYCKKCLCPFKAKLRSKQEICPIKKW